MKPQIFSFFSGAGFLDYGFEALGYDVVFVNEYYKPFLDCYKYARQKLGVSAPRYGCHSGSIEDLIDDTSAQLDFVDLVAYAKKRRLVGFIGGPPCPDFSVAGKNAGGDGDNGRLSAAYTDLICQYAPDFFVFENVKGLISTKKHLQFFNQLKEKLKNAGYCITENLVNALEYGVPQDRQRIFLIGFHRKKFLFLRETPLPKFDWQKDKVYPLEKILTGDWGWPATNDFKEDSILLPPDVPVKLTVEHWFQQNDVINHPNAQDYFTPKSKRIWEVPEGEVCYKAFKRLHRWRYSPTACYGNNEVHLHPYKARRISVAEALAIQSLPKEFELPSYLPLTAKFKTVGNGVPFLMAKGIASSILDFIEKAVIHE